MNRQKIQITVKINIKSLNINVLQSVYNTVAVQVDALKTEVDTNDVDTNLDNGMSLPSL